MSKDFGIPNEPETSSNLEITLCLATSGHQSTPPIEEFEKSQRELTIRAGRTRAAPAEGAPAADADPELIRLLLLGLVSCTENYFRQLLSLLLSVCPECQRKCSSTEVKFSAARYHQAPNIALSLLDESVFSSKENIESETKRLTGLSPSDSGSVKTALSEYHKVCIIRHASVHSHGFIGAKNAFDLGLTATEKLSVSLSVGTFERIAEICVNLVRAYNSHMWRASMGRLTTKGIIKFDGSAADSMLFSEMQRIFWSPGKLASGQAGHNLYDRLCVDSPVPPTH